MQSTRWSLDEKKNQIFPSSLLMENVTRWFDKSGNDVNHMLRPSRSPDLSPAERLLCLLVSALHRRRRNTKWENISWKISTVAFQRRVGSVSLRALFFNLSPSCVWSIFGINMLACKKKKQLQRTCGTRSLLSSRLDLLLTAVTWGHTWTDRLLLLTHFGLLWHTCTRA